MLLAAFPLICVATPAMADLSDKFTTAWSTTLTSNYIERSESKSQNDPSVNTSMVLMHNDSKLYGTILANSVALTDTENNTATLELKPGIGIYYRWEDYDTDIDAQIRYYTYPGYTGLDYPEAMVNLKSWIFRAEAGYSNEVFTTTSDGHYLQAGIDLPLEILHPDLHYLMFDGYYGHYHLNADAGGSYDYLKMALRAELGTFEVGLEYWDMNDNGTLEALNRYGHHTTIYITKYF
jgi:uncharacterized protein (TIGR02001 family)